MQIVRNSYEVRTKFVRSSYEVPNNHIHGNMLRHFGDEFRTKFARISYEFFTIFAAHWQKSHTNTTYACNEVPTPTHISMYRPPRHAHTHTNTHTHTDTHTHTPMHKHTHTLNESK